MGSVIGKENVAEPTFKVLLQRASAVHATYEIREYGARFVAEAAYADPQNNGTPFRALAGYIGVFGNPQNEGKQVMAMTAPVVMEAGTPIAMTAPVVMENTSNSDGNRMMKFFLPEEYDELSKIPIPSNPAVKISQVPPAVGAVHRYSGFFDEKTNKAKALELSAQLREDGLARITDEYATGNYQFWGYNPPFCLPMFRRNEVWIELTRDEVQALLEKLQGDDAGGLN